MGRPCTAHTGMCSGNKGRMCAINPVSLLSNWLSLKNPCEYDPLKEKKMLVDSLKGKELYNISRALCTFGTVSTTWEKRCIFSFGERAIV